jgi:PBSX family phage portal protein
MSNDSIKVFGDDGLEDPTESDLQKLSDVSATADVEKAEDTQQSSDNDYSARDYFTPKKDPGQLLTLLEKSETHQRCVSAKSKGVAGHGFDLVPHESVDADDVGEPPDALDEFWREGTFQLGPGAIHATANEVLESAWNDLEATGYLSIEVLANPLDGTPTGLAHVPSKDIRKRRDAPGYVELDSHGQPDGYYAPAGARYADDDPVFVDAETGEWANSAGGVGTVANELIVIRNYSALAPHYGLPDIVPGIKTLGGDIAAREYNRDYFDNNTVPRMAVIVEGGELTEKSWKDLEATFKKLRGEGESHRSVLLETKSTIETQLGESTGANIRIEPLGVGVQEDAGFIDYRDNNEHYILQAHGVPPVVAGRTQDVNRSTAKSQRVNFAQETIKPKQKRFAARLCQILHVQAFEEPDWTIEFETHGSSNDLRESKILSNKASAVQAAGKVLTANELRSELFDLPPIEDVDGDPVGQKNAPDNPPDDEQAEASASMPLEKADYSSGDVVDYGDGTGVVLEVMTDDFSWPQGEEDEIEVEASSDNPAIIVGRESGGAKIFRPDELSSGSFDGDAPSKGELDELNKANIPGVDDPETGFSSLPEGWTRKSVLQAWASLGGTWTSCVADMGGEVSSPKRWCSAMKDEVYGSERWRGRF